MLQISQPIPHVTTIKRKSRANAPNRTPFSQGVTPDDDGGGGGIEKGFVMSASLLVGANTPCFLNSSSPSHMVKSNNEKVMTDEKCPHTR
jgi:hypothetical protein